jgi:hypothetical protein
MLPGFLLMLALSILYDTFGPDTDTVATGDAGGRMACGVVERGSRR